jgi:hypothetical protein
MHGPEGISPAAKLVKTEATHFQATQATNTELVEASHVQATEIETTDDELLVIPLESVSLLLSFE